MLRKVSSGLLVSFLALGCRVAVARAHQSNPERRSCSCTVIAARRWRMPTRRWRPIAGPNNWQITQEGEEAIGTDTFSPRTRRRTPRRRAAPSLEQRYHHHRQQSTRTATAWRIHYQCKRAAAVRPPAPSRWPAARSPAGPPPAPLLVDERADRAPTRVHVTLVVFCFRRSRPATRAAWCRERVVEDLIDTVVATGARRRGARP